MPPRKVDDKKTRKALRKLRRAVEKAEQGGEDAKLSGWEKEFAQSVETRLETFGSAFTDSTKGNLDEPLSARQNAKLSEITKKASGKGGGLKRSSSISAKKGGFKRKAPQRPSRDRDIYDDMPPQDAFPDDAPQSKVSPPSPASPKDTALRRTSGPPKLRVVKGGKDDT